MAEQGWSSGVGKQIVTGIVMAVVGAALTLVLQSGVMENKIETQSKRDDKIEERLDRIETNLANGGPQPLAQRVSALEERVLRMEQQINGIYSVVVLRQKPAGQ